MTISVYRTLRNPKEARACGRHTGFRSGLPIHGQGDATLPGTTTALIPSLIHARITDTHEFAAL